MKVSEAYEETVMSRGVFVLIINLFVPFSPHNSTFWYIYVLQYDGVNVYSITWTDDGWVINTRPEL